MTHADERLRAVEAKRLRIDLRLVPQLQPARCDRLGDTDRGGRRLLARQERPETAAQAGVTERRGQRRKYREAEFLRPPAVQPPWPANRVAQPAGYYLRGFSWRAFAARTRFQSRPAARRGRPRR